jgi:hypothetical protein
MSPSPVPAPGNARGGNAIPVNGPKPKRKKPRTTSSPPRNQTTTTQTQAPYPQPHWPAPYNPANVAHQAQQAAQNAINQQLAAGMSALPTVQQQSAPYQQQISSETGLGQALLDQLKNTQTYKVNLATGVPQAFSQAAAATGGDATTAQQAASTLASFGTSAANQIAQQEATAPAATASNIRLINQRLQDLLSGPQGHDALARNLTSQIEQNRPSLELNYQNTYANQAQVPFNEALQLATANTNYDLAQQTYGLNQQGQQFNQNLQQQRLQLDKTNTELRRLGLKLQAQRATDSYNLTIKRLQQQATNPTNTQDAAAARQAQTSLARARTQVIQQANTLYKRTQGTGSTGGTTVLHYETKDPITQAVTPHNETVPTSEAQKRYDQLVHSGYVNVTRTVGDPGNAGQPGQSAGYLRNQAVNYGVTVIQQSAPWLPRAAAIRLAQQLVAGVFGNGPAPPPPPPPNPHAGAGSSTG